MHAHRDDSATRKRLAKMFGDLRSYFLDDASNSELLREFAGPEQRSEYKMLLMRESIRFDSALSLLLAKIWACCRKEQNKETGKLCIVFKEYLRLYRKLHIFFVGKVEKVKMSAAITGLAEEDWKRDCEVGSQGLYYRDFCKAVYQIIDRSIENHEHAEEARRLLELLVNRLTWVNRKGIPCLISDCAIIPKDGSDPLQLILQNAVSVDGRETRSMGMSCSYMIMTLQGR